MRKFIVKITLFSLFLVFALYGINFFLPTFNVAPFYLVSIVFFMLLTILIYSMLTKSLKQESKKFIYAFYFTTLIRLFGSLMMLLISLLVMGKNSLSEAIVFIILYFLYTGFEIVNLFPNLRPEIKENQNK